ncbi:MAG: transcription termination factor Rho, partial [Bacilli bacterium]
KGTGNLELHLDRRLADKRIYPAIDIRRSGTRREDLLVPKEDLEKIWALRKTMNESHEYIEGFLKKIKDTKTNDLFLEEIVVKTPQKSATATVTKKAATTTVS